MLAVAAGPPAAMQILGLIALSDPPRTDSASLISELKTLGRAYRDGDGRCAGDRGHCCPRGWIGRRCMSPGPIPDAVKPEDFAVFASILPEGKFDLVKAFQKGGHTVGMCGDGANDAPALRQAQIGIAVSTATDVAKSAAGVVLTEAGLGGIVAAVKEGRVTFQRILTYTLNSVLKKIVQVLLLAVGLVMTGHAVLTPMLMVIVMITGDFLAMSLTTDRVRPSKMPNSWQIGRITGGVQFSQAASWPFVPRYLRSVSSIWDSESRHCVLFLWSLLSMAAKPQSTPFGTVHFWGLRPTVWLVMSSIADLLIISTLATHGIAMAPLPMWVVACELAAAIVFFLILDVVKIPVFARLGLT